MAVATAMTAERMPMCRRRAWAVMRAALAARPGVMGMVAWAPASGAGSSCWAGVRGPPAGCPAAASVMACQLFSASTQRR